MKLLVIANPISGGRHGRRRVERLERALRERRHDVELFWTRGPGDASDRARAVPAGLERLVVAGGDGTLNEVLNGLVDPSRIPLTQLATGTANLLAHEFRLPRRPEALATLLEGGPVRRLDLGRLGERRFLAVASCGFDAMVTQLIQRTRSGRLGYRGYLGPIWSALRSYRPPRLEVTIDGHPPIAGGLVVVGNVRNYGGLFSVTDRAEPDSGSLDVCVFPTATVPDLVRYAGAGLIRRVSRLARLVYRTGRRIEIASAEPAPVQLDGDYWGTTPVTIEVVPGAIPFVVPVSDERSRLRRRRSSKSWAPRG